MAQIKIIEHYAATACDGDLSIFYNNLQQSTAKIQKQNLDVEIQYQQGGGVFSALIIGREKQN